MSTKLAELAGAKRLKGAVCVTDAKGVTHHYVDEAAAWAAWQGKPLEHRRGAFFEAVADPIVILDEPATRRRRGRRASTDE